MEKKKKVEKPDTVIPDKVIGHPLTHIISKIQPAEAIIYALSIGFSQNPTDNKELAYTYENHADFKPFPSIGCTRPWPIDNEYFKAMDACEGLPKINWAMLLHGEQKTEFFEPIKCNKELS